MAANAALSLWLRAPLGHAGLALANTIATTAEMVILVVILSRRLHGLEWPRLAATIIKASIAAALMAIPLWWAARQPDVHAGYSPGGRRDGGGRGGVPGRCHRVADAGTGDGARGAGAAAVVAR